MPFVTVTQMQDSLTPDQARSLIEKITRACIEVEGEQVRPVTVVLLQETLRPGRVGVGGRILGEPGQPR
ncbi:MAG TPA: tautomerase family protein [Myxococcaceae bacterium]|nr:tautomerase family protein [Myxococcaceae bacterium]